MTSRIIVRSWTDDQDQWEAHAEGRPEVVATGPVALAAAERLCEILGLDQSDFTLAGMRPGEVIYARRAKGKLTDPCPHCGGSGRYVGLNTVEDCGSCGGKGRVPW